MKMLRTSCALAPAAAGLLAFSALAQDQVSCYGTEGGGGGGALRQYQYDVWNTETNNGLPNIQLTSFFVGTDDMNPANYTNILMPNGWTWALQAGGIWENPGLYTPHGQIAPPPTATTLGVVHFWSVVPGTAIANGAAASFGFDNSHSPQNVDWFTTPQGDHLPGANWLVPVAGGLGVFTTGPVHGPIPSPGAMALLAGAAGMACVRRRAR